MSAADHLRDAIDLGCTRDDHDHVTDHRTEVLGEVAAWLGKKAREYRSTNNREHRAQAEVLERMADKIRRGAVRTPLPVRESKPQDPNRALLGHDYATPHDLPARADLPESLR